MSQPTHSNVVTGSEASAGTDTTTSSSSSSGAGGLRAAQLLLAAAIAVWPVVVNGGETTEEPPGERGVPRVAKNPSMGLVAGGAAASTREFDEPLVYAAFPERVQRNLDYGYRIALQRVHEVEACQGLFAELGADGTEMLQRTIYIAPRYDFELRACDDGATAFTFVGKPQTRLCDGFGRLSRQWAAVLLLHEALHFAGLGEWPSDPDGPTPDRINRMVARSCEL